MTEKIIRCTGRNFPARATGGCCERETSNLTSEEVSRSQYTIVDVAEDMLDNDKLVHLRELTDFLISIKLTPRDTKSGGTWVVKYKNKSVCHIRLNGNEHSWNISFSHFTREKWFVDYDKYFTDNELLKFISDNFHSAPSPNPNCIKRKCGGMSNKTIFGNRYEALCACVGCRIENPSGAELKNIKKLVNIIKQYISDL